MTTYASRWASGPPMTPGENRSVVLWRTAVGRRGYREDDVAALLDRLAAEVAAWQAEVELLRGENERLKHALRTWQTEQAQASTGKRWPTNGPWPGR